MGSINAIGVLSLVLLCVIMGAATYGAGVLSLYFKLSSTKSESISLFSTGILIGTAILFVLPEGVKTLYESLSKDEQSLASGYIGFSVLAGFVVMFVIDGLQGLLGASSQNASFNIEETDDSRHTSLHEVVADVFGSSITLGLILHGFVDGIALGSSFAEPDYKLQFTFFVAIIIHKLPTAFSLGLILLKEQLDANILKVHILCFALLSPCGALGTFFMVHFVARADNFAVAILFLFSAGTFLYVISHVMSETTDNHNNSEILDAPLNFSGHEKLSFRQMCWTLGGVCVPALVRLVVGES